MRLYIVRHGQTQWNKEFRMQGSGDSSLTEEGIMEAKKLSEAIEDIEFEKIYTSPLGRARETTNHIRGTRDIPVEIIDEIQEMGFGKLEGLEKHIVEDKYPEMVYNLWNNPKAYRNDTGEDFEEVYSRVRRGIKKITRDNKPGNYLLVTHGVIISVILSIIDGGRVEDTWQEKVVANTSVTIVDVGEDGELILVEKNNTDHLD